MSGSLVKVREVGLRDGLQMVEHFVPTEVKLAWLREEADAGVASFEITSFVSKSRMPQFADAEYMVDAASGFSGLETTVLTLNARGAQRAIEAGANRLVFVLSASGAHSRGNAGRETDAALQEFASVVQLARDVDPQRRPRIEAGIATAFGCTMEGSIDPGRVRQLATRLAELGADEIMLADTVGYAQPRQVGQLFAQVRGDIGALPLGGHFHDTRGLALANVVAALDAGVTKFDASLGGLGGCPFAPGASGNVAMEDLVYLLQAMGCETGIDLQALLAVRKRLSDWLPGVPLYGALATAGLPRHFNKTQTAALAH
ncbi:hydroxymethylglutaryl-CoA lyase [uncultured Azohydromonas sp.]|uniref:hydroxymethylglutaryl-CoA lyase n=1 Tax=uncultured Azohydromonas sp. TaxID=487342 RepID=UPI00260D18CA|nr:hydroxymethylglutaryl-CoA lyase [uncultured Azohydromonas sp.]